MSAYETVKNLFANATSGRSVSGEEIDAACRLCEEEGIPAIHFYEQQPSVWAIRKVYAFTSRDDFRSYLWRAEVGGRLSAEQKGSAPILSTEWDRVMFIGTSEAYGTVPLETNLFVDAVRRGFMDPQAITAEELLDEEMRSLGLISARTYL